MLSWWLLLMLAAGAISAVLAIALPRLRAHIPLVVPLVLGCLCTAITVHWMGDVGVSWIQLLWGAPLGDAPGQSRAAWTAGGLLVALLGTWLSFRLEGWLLRLRRRRSVPTAGLPVGGTVVDLPGRQESINGVARVARTPWLFALVSLISAAGEELLFRGAMLSHWSTVTWWTPVGVLVLQASLFALLHVAFGWQTIVAKAVLGLALGLGALSGGLLVAALLPHLLHQAAVMRQFTTRKAIAP